jgi:uncharacterized protein (TIGR02284 family)
MPSNKAVAKPDELISTLNGLIEIDRDGQKGFTDAADHIENPELKTFFLEQARTRARFIGELQQEVRGLGGDPENTGSTLGSLHRAWLDLKTTLGGGDHAILATVESGEDSAVSEYEKALSKELPANLRTLLGQQYGNVKQSHDMAKQFRDRFAKK